MERILNVIHCLAWCITPRRRMRASLTREIGLTILTEQAWPSVNEAGLTLLGLPASKGMLRQIALSLSRFRIQAKEIESAQTTLGERDTEEVVRIGEDGRNQIRYPGFGGQKSGT